MLAEDFKAAILAKFPNIEIERLFDLNSSRCFMFISGSFRVEYLCRGFHGTGKPIWIVTNRTSEGRGDTLDEAFNNFLGVQTEATTLLSDRGNFWIRIDGKIFRGHRRNLAAHGEVFGYFSIMAILMDEGVPKKEAHRIVQDAPFLADVLAGCS